MKKNLLFTIALIISLSTNAQPGLSNMSFETWSVTPFGNQPTGWFGFAVSQQNTGAQQGSRYVRIATTSTTSSTYDGAFFLTAVVTPTAVYSGAPYNQKPTALNGFYKTSGLAVGDTVVITSFLQLTGNLIAMGTPFFQTTNVSGWTSFSVPYSYFSTNNPDTIHIMGISNYQAYGGGPNAIGSTLDLDNLSLQLATDIDVMSVGTSFMVYPSPATTEINFLSKDKTASVIVITDVTGRVIDEIGIENEKTRVDLEKYSSGIYSYSIMNTDKSILLQSKFMVNK